MTGDVLKERGWKETDNRDNSLRSLLVILVVVGSIAASVIAFAYAAPSNSHQEFHNGMTATITNSQSQSSEPKAKVSEKDAGDATLQSEKEVNKPAPFDFSKYYDELLAKSRSIDKKGNTQQAADHPTVSKSTDEPVTAPADNAQASASFHEHASKPTTEPTEQPSGKPASDHADRPETLPPEVKTILQDVLRPLGELN